MSGHNMAAPGFSQSHDPFADLSRYDDDLDALNFDDDTYDGLGDQLDETDDAFNDDTFGGDSGGIANAPVGKDFDFFGSTAKVANAIEEEHVRFNRQQPAPRPSGAAASSTVQPNYAGYSYPPQTRPARTGYEKYHDPEPVGDLQIDASIWGTAPKQTPTPAGSSQTQPTAAPARKVMSLDEVEAALRAQSKSASAQSSYTQPQAQQHQSAFTPPAPQLQQQPPAYPQQEAVDYRLQQLGNQAQVYPQPQDGRMSGQAQPQAAGPHGHPVTILQRPSSKQPPFAAAGVPSPLPQQQQQQQPPVMTPTQILQNPNRLSGDATRVGVPMYPGHQARRSQGSFGRPSQGFNQLSNLSEQDKAAYLEAEARRAKRNHKIYVLSKDNGLMTPHDKSFITRIQLQQLVSAAGDPSEYGTDAALAEDFYYQVHSSLRVGQRPHPSQPLNNFAQTYLYQTGNRNGNMRRHGRGPENHVQRMEQQVQRAVEAAKNKPKNKQLVIEGSLGKISFSNAKTPKPLLNIKRAESGNDVNRPASTHRHHDGATDRKIALRAIEDVYTVLMKMEDHERTVPPPVNGDPDQELIERRAEWQSTAEKLNSQLWDALKVVHEPAGANAIHPFIALLSYPKGKKAIPRVFRQLSHEQRTTVLTRIIVNLDQLDVVQGAQVQSGEPINLSAAMRESIDVFSSAVMPCLFNLLNETPLHIVTAILGIISAQLRIDTIARTRIGISMLTMILSRAEIIKEAGQATEQAWQQWVSEFSKFFTLLEPTLPFIFPGTVSSGEDIYVWQFLAAIGIGANVDEQQRLVLAVKDRVMDTVSVSKTLPRDMAQQRLDSVNLFMRSIGLDVELLQ